MCYYFSRVCSVWPRSLKYSSRLYTQSENHSMILYCFGCFYCNHKHCLCDQNFLCTISLKLACYRITGSDSYKLQYFVVELLNICQYFLYLVRNSKTQANSLSLSLSGPQLQVATHTLFTAIVFTRVISRAKQQSYYLAATSNVACSPPKFHTKPQSLGDDKIVRAPRYNQTRRPKS